MSRGLVLQRRDGQSRALRQWQQRWQRCSVHSLHGVVLSAGVRPAADRVARLLHRRCTRSAVSGTAVQRRVVLPW